MFLGVEVDKAIELKELVPMSWQKEALNTVTIEMVNNLLVGFGSQASGPGNCRGSWSTS